MFKNILFVCVGNVCRSPMAEFFFRQELLKVKPKVHISSAGLKALVNRSAAFEVHHLMQKHGIDVSPHRARQFTTEMALNSDLILVMEKIHKNEVEVAFPFACGKVFLLGKWSEFEVPDPYGKSFTEFEQCFDLIQRAWADWKTRIC